MNNLVISGDSYTNNRILSGTVIMVQSLDGDELQYDTLDATLELGDWKPTIFKPKDADGLLTTEAELFGVRPLIRFLVSDPTTYKYGSVVIYKHNDALVGKYYMSSLTRVGKTQYRITCVSPVGLLANSQHYGGIYTGIRFADLLAEIIGGVVPFSVSPELSGQLVYGWLPIATRRDNLHQALFAMSAAAQKDANGDLYISALSDETRMDIPDSRLYVNGSVSYPESVTRVSVSEHAYAASDSDETVNLFDGLVAAERIKTPGGLTVEGSLVIFGEPMHNLIVENGEILESSVNYAVLAPSAGCKLTGQKYSHTVRQVSRPETSVEGNNETEKKITVTDATLVSIANSENVADRLMSYYSTAKTVSADIVVGPERAGAAVRFVDPFGDTTDGIITSMEVTMSNTLKAHAEIAADFSPGGAGNFYSHMDVVESDGTWTVPEGVTKIRVAVIGAGDGGEAGNPGESGTSGPVYSSIFAATSAGVFSGDPGVGGKGGKGGLGGKVLVASLDVTPGDVFNVKVGAAGKGAAYGGTPTAGGDTTFGDLSSADGSRSEAGYSSLFDGETYAMSGPSGVDGGAGQAKSVYNGGQGERPTVSYKGKTWQAGITAESVVSAAISFGGTGGGAAVGQNGGDGSQGVAIGSTSGKDQAIGGKGGTGATPAAAESSTKYGEGGRGGHGGGGGGGGGAALASSGLGGDGGVGGPGGTGGNGAGGCALIYY